MNQTYSISIYLDTRRAKANGKFPVKLRVYTATPRVQKMYPTVFEFSEKEFDSIWNTLKPRTEYKSIRKKIQAVETKANDVAEKLKPFTFEQFERQLYRKIGDGININNLYGITIEEMDKQGRVGTSSSYNLSKKSIEKFVKHKSKQSFNKLSLYDITPEWLKDYEQFMVKDSGKSYTTVGIYLRTLRAIFNRAIDENEIEKEYYPFGKRKYQIPATKNTKKALTKGQLNILIKAKPKSPQQQRARDFWFFSFACNGMNMKDIAQLKYKDIKNDKIEFYRAKTKLTSKANLKSITVYLNDYSKEIIKRYGIESNDPEAYVFGVLSNGLKPIEQHAKVSNFTRLINQHLKKLCKELDLPEEISTYWARHSFATQGVQGGATMEFMQESLGHKDMKTTMGYFAGFDDEVKKEFAEQLMNFE